MTAILHVQQARNDISYVPSHGRLSDANPSEISVDMRLGRTGISKKLMMNAVSSLIMVSRILRAWIVPSVLLLAGPVLLSGCGANTPRFVAKHEPWRSAEERACMRSGSVHQTNYLVGRSALNGPSVCGASAPFEMSGALNGRVRMRPAALLRCPMIPQVERWIASVDQAAIYYYGQPVEEIRVAASYSCRPINHKHGNKLSEHGYANALDVASFKLADGEVITLKGGWNGTARERAFLRSAHKSACQNFTTVLGPNYNRAHHDHFHVDLARRGRDGMGHVCK